MLDPSTGSRRAIVESAKPLTALNAALPSGVTLTKLPWPALDDSGRRGLYVLHGDIFLLDLENGDLTRLTSTAAQEGSATFSPDGRKIAFVRDHDLYVVDVASKAETRLTRDGSDTVLNGTLSWVYWEEIFDRRDIGFWWADDSSERSMLPIRRPLSFFVEGSPHGGFVLRKARRGGGMHTAWVCASISWLRNQDRCATTSARCGGMTH